MTTKRIVCGRPDGSVVVICPAPEYLANLMNARGITEDQAINEVRIQDAPTDAMNVEVMEMTLLPPDRVFRNAWTKPVNGPPVADLPRAREIQRRRIETARETTMRNLLLREALGENVSLLKAQVVAVNATALVASARTETELRLTKPVFLV